MKTKILSTTKSDIAKAAHIIREGGLVAFPTETVYGLGADALNADAVASVYAAKGRPSDNPMIVHIARASDMGRLTPKLSADIVALIENFWPGPLTMVVKKKPEVPDRTTGGLDTVAVRMPDSQAALDLITMADTPIAAPSANLSGSPSPTRAKDVIADMDGRIEAII
ncbi:MAG: L-threonylcarbamoyladenylate synthase, partial [Bacillota bacterium]|nr:L-threonylcarbamoyladenylate synthase [Bacillota bacterium]